MTATPRTTTTDKDIPLGDPGTLLFENDRVRVWELVMKPGEVCNWHDHDYDHLLLVVDGSDVEATYADGTVMNMPIPDNHVIFVGKGTQSEVARNSSSDKVLRELIIDLKESGPVADPTPAVFGFFQPNTPTTTHLP